MLKLDKASKFKLQGFITFDIIILNTCRKHNENTNIFPKILESLAAHSKLRYNKLRAFGGKK